MPKSATRTVGGKLHLGELARHLDAEAIVAKKDVADSRNKNAGFLGNLLLLLLCFWKRFNFGRIEEEAMARLPQQTKVAAGIFVENNGDMRLAFVILFDAFNGCDLAAQRQVENVSALSRKEAHAITRPYFHSRYQDVVKQASCLRATATPIRSLRLLAQGPQSAQHAMKLHELLRRHVFGSLQYLAASLVRLPHLTSSLRLSW